MADLILPALCAVCFFALGWQARDIRQERIAAAEFYEEYQRPCEHIHEQYGACEALGHHLFHQRGQMGWSGMYRPGAS